MFALSAKKGRQCQVFLHKDGGKYKLDELAVMKKQIHTPLPPPPKAPKPDEPTKKINDTKYVISFNKQPDVK